MGAVLQPVSAVAGAGRVRQQHGYLAGLPVRHGLGIVVQCPGLRKCLEDARRVALEVIEHQQRHAEGFFHDGFQFVQLLVVHRGPGAFVVGVGRAAGDLQQLLALGSCRESLDHLAVDFRRQILGHLVVLALRRRGQVHVAHVLYGVTNAHVVLDVHHQGDVADGVAYLFLGEWHGLDDLALRV